MRRECRESFPRHRLQMKPLIRTHVPCCMSGLLTRGGGENVPGSPGACATHNVAYLLRGPWDKLVLVVLDSLKETQHVKGEATKLGLSFTYSAHLSMPLWSSDLESFHERFFHRNSNSMEILSRSHPKCGVVIAMQFCTWHDGCLGAACTDFVSDLLSYNGVKLNPIVHQNWITMEQSFVQWTPFQLKLTPVCSVWAIPVIEEHCANICFCLWQNCKKLSKCWCGVIYIIWTPSGIHGST